MKDAKWNELIKQYEESDLTIQEFCETNNVSPSAFKYHLYSSKKKQKHPDTKFVSVIPENICDEVTFCLNGNRISFDPSLDDAIISKIVRAMMV